MKNIRITLLLTFLLITQSAFAQVLYSNTFGEKDNPAIIFLHGGPGYNSFTFEASTGQRLADEGYYVVVFDQRGCGRSENPDDSQYDFAEAVADVDAVYEQFKIKKATLIGHSWGGALGLLYAEIHPEKVDRLVLVGAPMDYPQTFKAILKHARAAYIESNKEGQLKYLDMLEGMDSESLQYANYCFIHAMASGLYTAKNPAPNGKEIAEAMKESEDVKQAMNMTQAPVKGLYDNERYTTLVLYDRLTALKTNVPVFGMYGSDDGLFDEVQLDAIKKAVGTDRFSIVKDASHSVFIDQQDKFIALLKGYME
ncbi:MAG: alpha/beta hydrolase [Chitinophagales bacterium]|nr:alpha/beta hydrolase [Chitinophagaceae bacterium]MCB9064803.1 alpha/beta hydrolase [Chitinophagales bacterium]